MNCFVYACEEQPAFVSQLGFICNTHSSMMADDQKDKIVRFCLGCNSAECIHVKDGVVDSNTTEDGRPETLGVNVSEQIKSGDRVG